MMRSGEIVSPRTYELIVARRQQRQRIRQMAQEAALSAQLENTRFRLGAVQRKLDEIAKLELVQRIRVGGTDCVRLDL